VRINGTVDGDVKVGAEKLVIGPDTRVSGTLFYGGPGHLTCRRAP
jgi:hypothetical protein